jgi:hypothetical protein
MGRKFKLLLPNGNQATVSLSKFTRGDLYGVKRVEKRSIEGVPLKAVALTADGAHIIPEKATSSNYWTDDGQFVTKNQYINVTAQGEPIPVQESVYSIGAELTETISLEDFFGYDIEATYILESEEDLSDLVAKCESLLQEDRLFRFKYAYLPTAYPNDALLIPHQGKIIIMLGTYAEPVWIGPATNIALFFADLEEEEDEEIDFTAVW